MNIQAQTRDVAGVWIVSLERWVTRTCPPARYLKTTFGSNSVSTREVNKGCRSIHSRRDTLRVSWCFKKYLNVRRNETEMPETGSVPEASVREAPRAAGARPEALAVRAQALSCALAPLPAPPRHVRQIETASPDGTAEQIWCLSCPLTGQRVQEAAGGREEVCQLVLNKARWPAHPRRPAWAAARSDSGPPGQSQAGRAVARGTFFQQTSAVRRLPPGL